MISNFFTPYSTTIICLSLLQIWCQVPRVISAFNCTQVGYFPHSQDPSKFYDCRSNSGPAAVYSCPNEHIYNASLKLCVPSVTTSITTTIALSTTTQKTPTTPVTKAVTTSITTTIALSTTTQKTPTTPVTKGNSENYGIMNAAGDDEDEDEDDDERAPRNRRSRSNFLRWNRAPSRGRGRGHKCFSKKLKEKIQCFKNESRSWKNHLISVSSSNDTKDILEKSLNNTDGIFSAFENERNSSQWFNPFDVLKILDDIGRDVANKSGNTTVTAFSDDIFIEITPLRLPYRFPNYSHNAFGLEQFRDVRDVIEFPKGLFSNSIAYHAVSALYLGLTDMLPTRVFQSNKSYEINSHVISSLIFPNVSTPFEKNIMIILKHLRPLERGDYSVCAYWDYSLRTNQGDGAWSRERCHVMTGRSNKTHTTCSCNHLTNFAILMGSENIPITKTHEFVLSVITYIGCALSLFGSVAAIAILVVLTRGLHSDRNIIHANLLISIAISQTVFLAGVEQTQDRTRCKFTAIMLHYFYLVSFAWMLCEGFHLYAMVIKVFNLTSRVYHYVAFAWGIPAFIVLITAVCRFKEYGTPSSCWISTEYYTLLAFILPVAITLLINIVILCLVMREICKLHVSESSHIKKMINSTFKTVAVLFPLLGITWIFGLLLFVTQQIMFQYLFAVFNSLQGFFIFVLHCLFNSEIRKNFKRKKEVWKSLRAFENVRRRIAISIIPVRSPVTKATTASNERAETFEKSS